MYGVDNGRVVNMYVIILMVMVNRVWKFKCFFIGLFFLLGLFLIGGGVLLYCFIINISLFLSFLLIFFLL